MTMLTSLDKARQLREKQAAELADAKKMEQQCLERVAKRKERDCLGKVKEDARKQRKDGERREKEEAAVVLPAQPPEKEFMEVDKPSPGINSLLTNMMQGTNNEGEGENIDPETRSPWKNKQKNDGPPLKATLMPWSAPEKSVQTKWDKHVHTFPHIVIEASIKLSDSNPFQEFIVCLQNLLKNG